MSRPPPARAEQSKRSAALHKAARECRTNEAFLACAAAVRDALYAREITRRQANRVLDTIQANRQYRNIWNEGVP